MPRVPIYDTPQVERNALPGVRQSSSASPALFGVEAQQQIATGRGLMQAGAGFARIAEQIRAEDSETEAKALDTEFANFGRDVLYGAEGDPATGYLSRQGKAAVETYGETKEALLKKKRDLIASASSDRVRKMLDRAFSQRLLTFRDTMDGHARQQRNAHMKATSELRVDSLADDMADYWANPTKHAEYLNGLKTEAASLADQNGITEKRERDEFMRKYTTEGHGRVLSRMISGGMTDEADKYLKQYSAEMDGAAVDKIQAHLTAADVQTKTVRVQRAVETMPGTWKEKYAALNSAFDSGGKIAGVTVSGEVYKSAKAALEHNEARAREADNRAEASIVGQAQDWVLKNPGRPITALPPNLYAGLRNKGHLAAVDSFAQREGRPAERIQELTVRGQMLDKAMNNPEAFVTEFRNTQFVNRMDLGAQGIREMQNIAGEMIRGDGRYRSEFNAKTLQDAIPKSLLAPSRKDERDAFTAIMSEEAERWKRANPGKLPSQADYDQITKAANTEWVSVGRLWNTRKPAYQARADQDTNAVPQAFIDMMRAADKTLTMTEILKAWKLDQQDKAKK